MKTRAWEKSIQEVLAQFGQAVSVSRVSIFENHAAADGTLLTSQRYEWTEPGITPQLGSPDLQGLPWHAGGFGRWVERMAKGEPVYGNLRDLPESEREVLAPLDVLSMVAIPIFVEDQWWGFAAFYDCWTEREWASAEINALRLAVGTLGAAIQRRRAEQAVAEELKTITALYAGAEKLTRSLDLQQVAESVVRTCVEEFGVHLAWVGQAEPNGSVRLLAIHPSESTSPRMVTVRWDDSPQGQGPTGRAIRTGTPVENARLFSETGLRLDRLRALHAVGMTVASNLDLRVAQNVLLDSAVAQLGVDAAVMLVLNPYTQVIEHAAGRGLRTEAFGRTRLRAGERYACRAALERRIISIPDLAEAPTDIEQAPWMLDEGFRAYSALPLIARGQVKGVLETFHRVPLNPTTEWLEFMEALGLQAAIAIDSAVQFDDLQRSHADLVLAYEATLEGWARAVELRDKETNGRTQGVADLTVRLARAMGVPEADLVHIRHGALLHDIGNLGIPDAILHKCGLFTENEREAIRQHPVKATELLSTTPYLHHALDIPLCHHEKWDGTGYPRGLRGEQIPLGARIFAGADVWDALRTARRDRPARTDEQARQYIRRQAGRHFDPRVVEAFLQLEL